MNIFKTGVLILLLGSFFACCNTSKDGANSNTNDKSFQVMTWNIWHGGLHGSSANEFKKDTANTMNIQKVLEQVNPDILFMQETYCCGMKTAKNTGFTYSSRGNANLSIHSKYPILETIDEITTFNSQAVIVEVNKQKLLCVNIWLDWRPDYFRGFDKFSVDSMIAGENKTRGKEITDILRRIETANKRLKLPIIMGGDFNSSSHLDWVESAKSWHFDKVIEWPVTKMVVDNGYTDSYRAINPNPIPKEEGTWGFLGNEGSVLADRIDYIFLKSKELKIQDSKIIKDDPVGGFFSSDHRGILTTFRFK